MRALALALALILPVGRLLAADAPADAPSATAAAEVKPRGLAPAIPAPLASHALLLAGARAGDRLVAVGERGHILLSDDSGKSWRQVAAPADATLTAVAFADARTGWAVGHDAVILHTTDAGEHWTLQESAPEQDAPLLSLLIDGDPAQGGQVLAIGAYGQCLASTDGGVTWEARTVSDEDRHYYAAVTVAGALVMVGEAGAIFRSEDKGRSWQPVPSPYAGSLFGLLGGGDNSLLAFGLKGTVLRSTDAGKSWARQANVTTASLMGGKRLADGTILLVGDSGTILTSTDGGTSFTAAQRPDRVVLSAVLESPDGGLVLLGEDGATRAARP